MTIPGDEAYDPCATYIKLRDAYLDIVSGGGVKRVHFRNGEEERETEFSQANVAELKVAMNTAKDECMALTTPGRSRRSAIGIGYQRPPYGRIY